jgi:ribonuclease BN (tRNA processing enzyme)
MSDAKYTILGSSSGKASPNRFCTSILLESLETNILLDVGEGSTFSLLRQGVDVNSIKHIFISHMHSDHVGGFPLLVQTMYLEGRKDDLEVYLPSEAVAEMDRYMMMLYLFDEKIDFRINYYSIGFQYLYQGPNIKVKAYPNRHLLGYKKIIQDLFLPLKMESFCFGIESYGKRTIFSGDIGSLDDLNVIIQDVDLLICESMHIELFKLFGFLKEKQAKRVVLIHIPVDLEPKTRMILQEAKDNGMENIEIAYDGLVVEL